MYNFKFKQQVPLHLPVAVSACLAAWFADDVLEEGLTLLRETALSHFFFHRHVAGALFHKEYALTIVFEKTKSIRQGFTLKTDHCSLCGTYRHTERCKHIAALALLSLVGKPDGILFPMPLLFKDSQWGKVAGFVYDWLSREKGSLEYSFDREENYFKRAASEGGFQARISASTAVSWEPFGLKTTPEIADNLYKTAQKISMSKTERELMDAGSPSRAHMRDSSVWSRLCTLFSGLAAEEKPVLSYEKTTGLFQLSFQDGQTSDLLKIDLPRHRTLEILAKLDLKKSPFSTLQPARQGYGVSMDRGGNIVVNPLIWRDDQQASLLSDISDRKFGSSYFFPREGFLPLKKHDPKGKIIRPGKKQAANPLLDFLEQDSSFVVSDSELEDFLKENRSALTHPDNQVDRKILELQVKSLPDSLIIHEFREDQDWYYISCDYGLGEGSISLQELLEKREEKRNALYSGSNALQLKDTPLSWFHDLAEKREWTDSRGHRGVRLRPGEFISLVSIIEDVQSRLRDNSFQRRLEILLDGESWRDTAELANVPSYLRSYQKNGLSWLHTLYDLGLGGILADDMGLGKTHQGLALLEMVGRRKKEHVMLVVCPASVLLHWRDKIDRFYPEMEYCFYYGQGRDLRRAAQSGLILTTYGVVRSDREQLAEMSFEVILLDEIQNLKNRKTGIHKAVDSLQSRVKIGLSGTPIENSLMDLYALFNICLPGIFGTLSQFRNTFVVPIAEDHDEQQKNNLSRLIQPFILRRSRKQVLTELPGLIEDDRVCELSEDQIRLYRQAIDEQQLFLEELEAGREGVNFFNILTLITRLKQICNHPSLVEKESDPDKYKSGKWDLFLELLDESLGNDRKVVVFSQYTGMLDIMEHYLGSAGINYATLRGRMTVAGRQKMINKFTREKDCMVFCSSLLAGGTGIDLLAGQVVIHYDRWWNPAKEEQATARVHRMGQKDVVQLFRLITKGTLEEKIHAIISRKEELASSIINEDEAGIIKQLDRRQLVELFR
ncbi:MAG: DEAD/DEAH box helicase [Deltaproteobacteria bacterium]|nr:DEAD/DEAH box helicase [Deltaproteobacteria bacterium]